MTKPPERCLRCGNPIVTPVYKVVVAREGTYHFACWERTKKADGDPGGQTKADE